MGGAHVLLHGPGTFARAGFLSKACFFERLYGVLTIMIKNYVKQIIGIGRGNSQNINFYGNSKEKNSVRDKREEPVTKILILSANPIDTGRLRFDHEIRDIKEGLRLSKYREKFEIEASLAVRFKDLRRDLLRYRPHIVHFIGHGEADGVKVEDIIGNAVRIAPEVLSGLLKLFTDRIDRIQCVILRACYSAAQADAINRHIEYVIGMRDRIMDKAAIEFAVGFYDALGAGEGVERAFDFGCNAIHYAYPDFPAHMIPVLKIRENSKGGTPRSLGKQNDV